MPTSIHDDPQDPRGVATHPTGRSGTRPSHAGPWHSPTPDSLLGIGESEQRVVRDAIKARLFPKVAGQATQDREGSGIAKIGRFDVLRRIGEGGMGVVFAAYDEQLDRKVAIKLLRGHHRGDDRSRARLLREAQALARLSHPNVVQVHEVGEWKGEVYVAMEFVPGQTLRRWLERPRPWLEILEVLIQAGRGLEAAHAGALVHRDFKPDNVMVGETGRVRVLDFGLVRASEALDPITPSTRESGETSEANPLGLLLTRAGSVLGTPVYMAPEQHVGEPADARSDQFSFCVTAFEALFGRRPFAGESLIALIEATRSGELRAIPSDSAVSRRVREAVLRGLSADPGLRWPSMTALLAELEAGRGRPRWALLAAGGGGALVAGVLASSLVAFGGPWSKAESEPSCADIDLDALAGTWDVERRHAIEESMLATELPYAASSFAMVERRLDAWAEDWVATERRACEATLVHNVQSRAALDRQQACMLGQARQVAGLLEVFGAADQAVLEHASELLDQLPDPSHCEDPDLGPTLEPALAQRVASLEPKIGELQALLVTGKLEPASALLVAITREAEGLGHPATELRIAALALELDWKRGFEPEVAQRWRALAGEARLFGLDALEVDLRVGLAVATSRSMPTLAATWLLDDAELILAARDETTSDRALRLQRTRAQLLGQQGRHAEALALARSLVVESQTRGAPELEANARQTLANLEADAGDLEAAELEGGRARVLFVERWGEAHPRVAALDHDLAIIAMERGEFDKARELLDQAEAVHRANPGSLALADDQQARVTLAVYTGELGEAGALARAAVEVYERELGPGHETTLRMLELRGIVRYYEGDFAGSLADYDRVLPGYLALFGERDVQVGLLHLNRGDTLMALGRPQEAEAEAELALALLSATLPDSSALASALAGRGEARLALGEVEPAIEDLEAALVGITEITELAETRFALARALAAADRDPARVAELSDLARASFEALGLTTQLETLDRWRGR